MGDEADALKLGTVRGRGRGKWVVLAGAGGLLCLVIQMNIHIFLYIAAEKLVMWYTPSARGGSTGTVVIG